MSEFELEFGDTDLDVEKPKPKPEPELKPDRIKRVKKSRKKPKPPKKPKIDPDIDLKFIPQPQPQLDIINKDILISGDIDKIEPLQIKINILEHELEETKKLIDLRISELSRELQDKIISISSQTSSKPNIEIPTLIKFETLLKKYKLDSTTLMYLNIRVITPPYRDRSVVEKVLDFLRYCESKGELLY